MAANVIIGLLTNVGERTSTNERLRHVKKNEGKKKEGKKTLQ